MVAQKRAFSLGIGAPRSGTTWLYKNMRNSADLYLPPVKELRFFKDHRSLAEKEQQAERILANPKTTDKDRVFVANWRGITDGNVNDYVSLFPKEGHIGEVSPIYSILTGKEVMVIQEALADFDAKVFYMMRNPFFRDISHIIFAMHRQRSHANTHPVGDYEKYIDTKRFQRRSGYQRNVRVWRAAFKQNLNVFYFDELATAPKVFFKKFARAMELDYDPEKVTGVKENRSGRDGAYAVRLPSKIVEKLRDRHLSEIPESRAISKYYKAKWIEEIKAYSTNTGAS